MLQTLETKLNELLVTKAPFQLPDNWRKWLGNYAWVFALIGLVLGVFSVLILLPVLGFGTAVGALAGAGGYVFFAWISFFILLAYTVLLGVAMPKLKRKEKSGWDLIFYSNVFFLAYDVFNWLRFMSFGSFFGLVWNILWAVVGLYFIFQIRGQFTGKAVKAAKVVSAKPAPKKK